jgi:GTP-binding protein EngB required for normal cell division
MNDSAAEILETVETLCNRYHITALDHFLGSCREFAAETTLNVAILGRFKTGKSSLLNQLIGQHVLPVGVTPVTAVITEVLYGEQELAQVVFLDGHIDIVGMESIGAFITETENPENTKRVSRVVLTLPSMERYPGIRFVDTPGLYSVFQHNTAASIDWLPHVALALVTVAIDLPLSQEDVEFIRELNKYTPNVSLLLTKVDMLDPKQRVEVTEFVERQLERHLPRRVPVFLCSVRPGFEALRLQLEELLLSRVRQGVGDQQTAILNHKLQALMTECSDYLNVALKAAESADAERSELKVKVIGQKESFDETKLALRLAVRHATANLRSQFDRLLQTHEAELRERLQKDMFSMFPAWTHGIKTATENFESWAEGRLADAMTELSQRHRNDFMEPLERVSRQLSQSLQDFRGRLSERTLDALGVPLRTTEIALQTKEPQSPDIRLGRMFDHNWELLSFLIPMTLFAGMVRNHFSRKVAHLVVVHLSRLASQWEEIITSQLHSLEEESLQRLNGFISTVEGLIGSTANAAPGIRSDIEVLKRLRKLSVPTELKS